MLYDIPVRTGRKIAASTTIDLVTSHATSSRSKTRRATS